MEAPSGEGLVMRHPVIAVSSLITTTLYILLNLVACIRNRGECESQGHVFLMIGGSELRPQGHCAAESILFTV
jgi:hypothetical protein